MQPVHGTTHAGQVGAPLQACQKLCVGDLEYAFVCEEELEAADAVECGKRLHVLGYLPRPC